MKIDQIIDTRYVSLGGHDTYLNISRLRGNRGRWVIHTPDEPLEECRVYADFGAAWDAYTMIPPAERKSAARKKSPSLINLKRIRTEKGYSQKTLGVAMGYDNGGFISHIEKSKHGTRVDIAARLAKVLGVEVEELFKKERDEVLT